MLPRVHSRNRTAKEAEDEEEEEESNPKKRSALSLQGTLYAWIKKGYDTITENILLLVSVHESKTVTPNVSVHIVHGNLVADNSEPSQRANMTNATNATKTVPCNEQNIVSPNSSVDSVSTSIEAV